jgi:hypothetical protein
MARFCTSVALTIAIASWLLFVFSFFLPATNVLVSAGAPPGTPLTGWEAFSASIWDGALNPWVWLADLRVLLFLVYPFANSLMLFAPFYIGLLRQNAFVVAVILLPCAILPWRLPKPLTGEVFIGFYCWNGSYIAMCVAAVVWSLREYRD